MEHDAGHAGDVRGQRKDCADAVNIDSQMDVKDRVLKTIYIFISNISR